MKTTLDHALFWLESGFWPVPHVGKHAFMEGWSERRPTASFLRNCYSANPHLGLGLRLGSVGELVDIDVDDFGISNHREALGRPVETLGWSTRRSASAHHLLFAWDDRLERYSSRKAVWKFPGWELRLGNASKAVSATIPPTRFDDGSPRVWFGAGIARLPDSLFDWLKHEWSRQTTVSRPITPSPTHVQDWPVRQVRALAWLRKCKPAVEGSRGHNTAFGQIALLKGFAVNREELLTLAGYYNEMCEPPLSDFELDHKVREVAEKSRESFGFLLGNQR